MNKEITGTSIFATLAIVGIAYFGTSIMQEDILTACESAEVVIGECEIIFETRADYETARTDMTDYLIGDTILNNEDSYILGKMLTYEGSTDYERARAHLLTKFEEWKNGARIDQDELIAIKIIYEDKVMHEYSVIEGDIDAQINQRIIDELSL